MSKYFFAWETQFMWRFYSFFFCSKSVTIRKEISDSNGRILVLKVKIDDEIYLLVNLYNNSNTEPE